MGKNACHALSSGVVEVAADGLSCRSSYITPGSISPAASLPPGFYTITDLPADATSVWLVVHVPNSGSGSYADFAASAVFFILFATAESAPAAAIAAAAPAAAAAAFP